MGGKSSQSTQQVTIPPEVLARYNAVNSRAEDVANTPFQIYSKDPSSFVQPLNQTQDNAIANANSSVGMVQPYINSATGYLTDAQSLGSGMLSSANKALLNAKNAANGYNASAGNLYGTALSSAQPYNSGAGALFSSGLGAAQPLNQQAEQGISSALAGVQPINQTATGLAAASGQAVNPDQLDIGKYLSPYLGTVLGSTAGLLNQGNQQAMSGQTGNAIRQGAFGGDRGGIAAANLAQQQQLANANIFSGILNTGYGSALGAAQQQQGVGLGAAQANRAALGSSGSELADIGQQQFGQGLGAAQAQAGLGQQEFGQGIGAGQAVQGLGQQVFGQNASTGQNVQGLGNQVFGQGLATSQQEAALAGQEYGMGSNTSQQLAGLGQASQNAILQGMQAQLGAGQVQQQTGQAGLTALYNQFLQQQSYPFQVAQFLANIAEGTGSLSGSTTTTTQPGGFFSDKRLKDDVREVGETFDGQPIVTYKYKGDDRTRMGLIAQDVEKKHPHAVGLASGFRTVDYGKATDDAAKRGHFAEGGMPLLPGLSPGDMQQLLAAQAQMYAPFSEKGGLYGGQASGAVRGGSSYVPQASLPVSHLTVASGLAPQRTAAENAKSIADAATQAEKLADSKYGQKAIGWFKGLGAANDDHSNDNTEYRGGLVRAKKYAAGGTPYGDGLDIPDEKPDVKKLETPGDLPGQRSGMQNVSDAASTALAVAKLAAMFAKNGGRIERADGGGVDDGDFVDSDGGGGGGTPWYLKPLPGPAETGHAAMSALRSLGSAYERDQDRRRAESAAHPVTGEGFVAAQPVVAAAPKPGLGAAIMGAAPRPKAERARPTAGVAPAPAVAAGAPMETQTAPIETAPQATGVAPASENFEAPVQYTPEKSPGVLSRVGDAVKSGLGNYAHDLGRGDVDTWLSLLSGIGAAGTAPTVHPGVALAAGLTGGAQAYMGAKKAQADIERTQVGTKTLEAPAPQEGYTWVPGRGPNGEGIVGKDGTSVWHREMNVNVTNFASPHAQATGTPSAVAPTAATPAFMAPSAETLAQLHAQYGVDPAQPGVANHERAVATNPQVAALDQAARESVQKRVGDLQSVENAKRQILQLSEAVNGLSKGGIGGQGHGSEWRAHMINVATTAANMLGIPVDPSLNSDLTDQMVANKIRQMMGPTMANQNNQQAASVAHAITGVLPGGDLTPAAANEILSSMLVQTQQPRDLSNYANRYAQSGLMVNVEPAFAKDTGATYDREQRIMPQFMASRAFAPAMADLRSHDASVRDRAIRTLDEKYGVGFHRYFTGEQ